MEIAPIMRSKDGSDLEKKIILFIRRAGLVLMGQVTVRAEVERKRTEDDDEMQGC